MKASVLFLFALPACSKVVGLDEYYVAPPEPDAGRVELPLLPAIPDPDRIDACTECVRTSCADLRTTCLGSPRCKALLSCEGRCSDPNCLARCSDALPPSPDFDDYFACAFGAVAQGPTAEESPIASSCTVCGPGKNFACAGSYSWDRRPAGGEVKVDLQLFDLGEATRGPLSTLLHTKVAACDDLVGAGAPMGDSGCSPPWLPVDNYGSVHGLELIPSQTSIAIEGGDGEHQRYYPGPISRSTTIDVWAVANGGYFEFLPYVVAFFPNYDATLGMVVAAARDCLLEEATARVELANAPGSIRFLPTANPTPSDDPGLVSMFINVEPTPSVTIQGTVDGISAPVLSTATVVVAGGWLTSTALFPRER
jgi:hypothetical protein